MKQNQCSAVHESRLRLWTFGIPKGLTMLTGRQIAFMLCAFYNVQGRAIGMNDLLNIELRNDSLKMFDQAWDETLMAMDIETNMAFVEGLYYRRLEKSTLMRNSSAHIQFGSSSPNRAKEVHNIESNGGRHYSELSFVKKKSRSKDNTIQSFFSRKVTERKELAGGGHPKSRAQEAQSSTTTKQRQAKRNSTTPNTESGKPSTALSKTRLQEQDRNRPLRTRRSTSL